MPDEIRVSKSTLAVVLLLVIVIGIIIWQVYYAAPPTVTYKYTTGLTVKFKVYNPAIYQLETSNVQVEFYPSGTDPFQRTFTTKPIATASYDSVNGYWTVPLDAGTYVVLIRDIAASKSFYPEYYTVTVPGTNSEDKEVWLDPSQLNVYDRASITLTTAIKAYNSTSGAYDITVTSMNTTQYTKFLLTITMTVSDADYSKVIKAGRLYLSKISSLTPTSASVNGATSTVLEDTDGSDDGMTGYYVEMSEMEVGEIHRVDIYFEASAAVSGTMTIKMFEYYSCLRTALRWWTDQSTTISVVT